LTHNTHFKTTLQHELGMRLDYRMWMCTATT
jgi:hypothetical protein